PTVGESAVGDRARAGGIAAAVEPAPERRIALARLEAEARRRRVAEAGWAGADRGVGRNRVHRPGRGGRAAGVAGRIGRPDLEGVVAVGEAAVALRARAGRVVAVVEPALEARIGFARSEAEARRLRVAETIRPVGDRRLG